MSWNLYGPFATWRDADFASPIQTLTDAVRETAIAAEDRPTEGASGLYVLRRCDALGREETSATCVAVTVVGGAAVPQVWAPAWPAAAGWTADRRGDAWVIEARWGGRFDALGVTGVELVEQEQGEEEQVAETFWVRGCESAVGWRRTPAGSLCRYRVRARSAAGAVAESPWSAWMKLAPDESRDLQLI